MNARAPARPDSDTLLLTDAAVVVFGYPPAPVRAAVRPRSRAWRIAGAARTMGIFLLVVPLVAVVPPHAPWAIGALIGGFLLSRRRWIEEFTLESLDGPCPRCGEPLRAGSQRLRVPHPVPCEGCHHIGSLRLPEGFLEASGSG